jgi:hypothetical protein
VQAVPYLLKTFWKPFKIWFELVNQSVAKREGGKENDWEGFNFLRTAERCLNARQSALQSETPIKKIFVGERSRFFGFYICPLLQQWRFPKKQNERKQCDR